MMKYKPWHKKPQVFTLAIVGILLSAGIVLGLPTPILNHTQHTILNAPLNAELWNKTYGGSNIDIGYSVKQTSDNGYIIAGYTRSYGASGHNVWLIKTDAQGTMQWNKTFGGSSDDEAQCVAQTTDGGYIITGFTKSLGAGGKDLWLIKTDASGNEVWDKFWGGTSDDAGTCVLQTTDGGYIISGYTSSYGAGSVDAWLIKTNASGNQVWAKTLGGMSSDGAWWVLPTSDGYALTGWTYSYSGDPIGDAWLVKTDLNGNQLWYVTYGGNDVDRGYCLDHTTDGGYIITGYTASMGAGLDDMLLIKTYANGTQQWLKTFGGTGRDYGNAVVQTTTGGYIIAGYTLSYGAGSEDVWVVKTDAAGNQEWSQTFGGTYSDEGWSIQQTSDWSFIVAGFTLSHGAGVHDVWLIKIAGDTVPPLEVDAGGPYSGMMGVPVEFTGNVSGGIPPYQYHWDFGDGNTSEELSPSHGYAAAGSYQANFSVADSNGSIAGDTASVTILADTTSPAIAFIQPLAHSLYLKGKRLLPFPITLCIGAVIVTVTASDNESGVASVAFSLNGVVKSTDIEPPYEWTWEGPAFGRFTLGVEARDNAGNNASIPLTVWRFF